jgi:CBS domain
MRVAAGAGVSSELQHRIQLNQDTFLYANSHSRGRVGPDTPVTELAKLICEHDIGAIPIGENDRLIGMVIDRDIVCKGLALDCFDASRATARGRNRSSRLSRSKSQFGGMFVLSVFRAHYGFTIRHRTLKDHPPHGTTGRITVLTA